MQPDRTIAAPSPGSHLRAGVRRLGPEYLTALSIVAAWLILTVTVMLLDRTFFSQGVFLAICFGMATLGILAVGQSIVIVGGGLFDLSLAINASASALLVAFTVSWGWPIVVTIAVALGFGALFGLINGLVIVWARINPIIATFGTSFIGVGLLALVVARVTPLPTMPVTTELRRFGISRVLGVPSVMWVMLAFLLVVGAVITHTRAGQHLLGVGGNVRAAKARGINVRRMRVAVFTLAGASSGFAGLMIAAQFEQARNTVADGYQFSMIAAAILGGMSLAGGRSSFVGLFAGLLLVATIPTALAVVDLSSAWSYIIQGVLLLAAVSIDARRVKRSIE
jgi:ribose transport system permease protein